MNDPNYNVFEYFTNGQNKLMRESLVNVVLSTDPVFHSEMLAQFNQQVDNGKRKRLNQLLGKLDFTQKGDVENTMGLIMHICDVSNSAKPLPIYYKWVELLFVEFFDQGDREKSLSLKPSMLCDRDTTNIAKAQVGFIDFIIKPAFVSLSRFLDGMDAYLA